MKTDGSESELSKFMEFIPKGIAQLCHALSCPSPVIVDGVTVGGIFNV